LTATAMLSRSMTNRPRTRRNWPGEPAGAVVRAGGDLRTAISERYQARRVDEPDRTEPASTAMFEYRRAVDGSVRGEGLHRGAPRGRPSQRPPHVRAVVAMPGHHGGEDPHRASRRADGTSTQAYHQRTIEINTDTANGVSGNMTPLPMPAS
jgi:hypothetical protein